MTDFGDIRSAAHAKDVRRLLALSFPFKKFALSTEYEQYILAVLPEDERIAYQWACVILKDLLRETAVPTPTLKDFVATWAEWVLSGTATSFPLVLAKEGHEAEWYNRVCLGDRTTFFPNGHNSIARAFTVDHFVLMPPRRSSKQKRWDAHWLPTLRSVS